jgi:hypothetical protein
MIHTLYVMNHHKVNPVDESMALHSEAEVCQKLKVPVPTFRKLRRQHLIPYLKFGYRTFKYDIVAVRRALNSLEVKAAV